MGGHRLGEELCPAWLVEKLIKFVPFLLVADPCPPLCCCAYGAPSLWPPVRPKAVFVRHHRGA